MLKIRIVRVHVRRKEEPRAFGSTVEPAVTSWFTVSASRYAVPGRTVPVLARYFSIPAQGLDEQQLRRLVVRAEHELRLHVPVLIEALLEVEVGRHVVVRHEPRRA
jgi:hypothetical protein